MEAPSATPLESPTAFSQACGGRFPRALALSLVLLGMALLIATPAAHAQTIVPQQAGLGFSAAPIGTTTPQTLTASFTVSGYTGSFTPAATMRYGHDYTVGAANCTSTGAGTESCSFSVTFAPTLPGTRKDAILVGNGAATLATVLVYGMGQGPLAVFQPGVSTQVTAPVSLYDAAVDENGTAYLLGNNTGEVFSFTKAGVLTQLPVTGLSSPTQIAIDGAGMLYFSQEAYGNKIVTYSASGVQGAITMQPGAPYAPCANGIVNGNPIEFLSSIAVDGAGDIFVVEDLCSEIFELKSDGTYATFPIDPAITQPAKLAVDDAGDVFIGGYSINELTAGGVQKEINTRENMASVIGNTQALGVYASGLLYTTPYPGTLNGAHFGVAQLPPSDYTTPELDLDAGAPLNGIGLGADGTFFRGGYFGFTKIDRSQGALTFGLQNLGVTSAAQSVQFVNIGNEPLTISSVGLLGDSGFQMQPTGAMDCTNGLELTPSAYCQAAVTLTPNHAGNSTGSLVFTDNSQKSAGGTQIVSLNGYVNGAYVTASPSPLIFASQPINTTSPAQTVTLTNDAVSGTANIGKPTSSNPVFVLSANNCSAGIAPGTSCQLFVTFTPLAAGTTTGTISASVSGGVSGGTISFGVMGVGIAPPASLNIAETIQVSDGQPAILESRSLAVTETIHVTDADTVKLPPALNIAETIHVTDANSLLLPAALNVAETVHVTDVPVLLLSAMLNIVEVVHTSDAPVLTTSPPPPAATQILLSSSVNPSVSGQTVTFTAAVSPLTPNGRTPGGLVQFFVDGNQAGSPVSLNAAGQALYSTSTLPDGQSTIFANYTGNNGFLGSISTTLLQSVLDFTFAAGAAKAATVFPGQSAAFEFTVAPRGAFSSPVTFSASGLPPGATASFNPQSVTPSAAPTTVVLTIQTAKLSAAVRADWPFRATPPLLLGILLPLFGMRDARRSLKRSTLYLTALVSLGVALAISGCGGRFLNQAPQTYPITVTASCGTLKHSTTVNLTVE